MVYDISVMKEFIATHHSQYIGKYRYHSGYRTEESGYKAHYYMLDQNFRQIDIYVDIFCKDQITYTFSEDLHEQEKIYIIKDILQRIIDKSQYKSTLHYSLYDNFIKTISNEQYVLEPIDFYSILNYMKYHQGINQKTMDTYYKIFIPCLKTHLKNKNYESFMDSVNILLDNILYQYEWDGTNSKYLDTEYQFHLYYIREIVRIVYENLDKFYKNVPDQLFEAIHILCLNTRLSFAIMTDFGSMLLSQYRVTNAMINHLKNELVLNDKDEERENVNLVFSYIYYIFHNDFDQYYAVILKVLRGVINNMLTFANHDLDLALGNSLVKSEGYQVLLDLFHEDYNTFVFTCFPIDTFPLEMKPKVRDELVTAIQFFAARMESDNYRLSSFEQVMNINRLLMDNFKEWYK
ncbi:hypothetical protein [Candidatus Stoquefichus sp. SB1]|jgi:hypothetical protein|uniref:hypothetical protein n=1 Tax=Candidatus Stoquefichus sp. SB1 TaxID=1658109 RepID=UPI00067ECA84|nr:hypothetical protein [Candidatus Stoquefichus sp. SB1]